MKNTPAAAIEEEETQQQASALIQRFGLQLLNTKVLTRAVTFGTNVAISRYLDPNSLGTSLVSWGLFETIALFFLGEGTRRACLRAQSTSIAVKEAVCGQALNFLIILILTYIWCKFLVPTTVSDVLIYRLCTIIVGFGFFLHILYEVMLVVLLREAPDGTLIRINVESTASIAKTLLVPLTGFAILPYIIRKQTLFINKELSPVAKGLLFFAIDHFFYALFCYIGYIIHYLKHEKKKKVTPDEPLSSISLKIWDFKTHWTHIPLKEKLLLKTYSLLAIQKIVLNEVERSIVVFIYPSAIWPMYSLVTSLGGIVCRLVFSPFETFATTELSKLHNNPKVAAQSFREFFHSQLIIGLSILLLFQPLSTSFLLLLYGYKWIHLGTHIALQRYCYLITLMSINGQCEAFMYAIGSSKWFKRLRRLNIVVFLIGLTSALCFRFTETSWSNNFNETNNYSSISVLNQLILSSIISFAARICVFIYFIVEQGGKLWSYFILPSKFISVCYCLVVIGGLILRLILKNTNQILNRMDEKRFTYSESSFVDEYSQNIVLWQIAKQQVLLSALVYMVIVGCCVIANLRLKQALLSTSKPAKHQYTTKND